MSAPQATIRISGSVDKPIASLHRAQELLRSSDKRGKEPVSIILSKGIHYLGKPLILEAADSGSKDAPVTFTAAKGETAVISGGADFGKLAWKPYRDGIMMAAVPEGTAIDILYVNDETMPMARYPNFDPEAQFFNGIASDAFSKEKAAGWENPKGGFMHAMHKAKWGGMHYRITGKDKKGGADHTKAAGKTTAPPRPTKTSVSSKTSSKNSMHPASGSSTPGPTPSTSTRPKASISTRHSSKPPAWKT